jgi:low temperature requirement protein LtrA
MARTSKILRPSPMREFDVGERRATWLELFFDLCFVAAIAALSTRLQLDHTLTGALSFVGLFVAVWWAWMTFTWFATAWDNDDVAFRLFMLGAMLLVIVLAATIPDLGHEDGNKEAVFATSFAGMQFLLAVMFVRVLPHAGEARLLVLRYLVGHLLGGLLFVASIAVEPPVRYWLWAAGVAELMTMPVVAVRAYTHQPFDSRHIPERYGLFAIIVLGESVVSVSAGLGEVRLNVDATVAAVVGFGIAAAVWWSYFETVSSSALDRSRLLASLLWGYGHFFVYAGIALLAVGVELAIGSAVGDEPFDDGQRALLCGGPAAILFGLVVIHEANERHWDAVVTARLMAVVALVGVALVGDGLGPLGTVVVVFAVMAVTTAIDVMLAGGEGLAADHVHEDTVAEIEA